MINYIQKHNDVTLLIDRIEYNRFHLEQKFSVPQWDQRNSLLYVVLSPEITSTFEREINSIKSLIKRLYLNNVIIEKDPVAMALDNGYIVPSVWSTVKKRISTSLKCIQKSCNHVHTYKHTYLPQCTTTPIKSYILSAFSASADCVCECLNMYMHIHLHRMKVKVMCACVELTVLKSFSSHGNTTL